MLCFRGLYRLSQIFIIFITLLPISCSAEPNQDTSFKRLADDYIDNYYFPNNPTEATQAGIHLYDDKLEDYSKSGIAREIEQLKKYEKQFAAVDPNTLSEQIQGDRDLLLNEIHSVLLSLETIRGWEKNPDVYSSGITNSTFVIMARKFAPANDRLRVLIARERLMPAVFQAAKENLKNPPKIYTEIALEQLPDLIDFFKNDVPKAFVDANDPVLKKQFKMTNDAVIKSLKDYQSWLKKSLLPASKGDFRIGKETFEKKLMYDEMVSLPLDKLIAIDYENMRENQKEFSRIANEIDSNKTAAQILEELKSNHPEPEKLLSEFSNRFDTLIQFIRDKKIITIPSDVKPIMEESPPFLRAMTLASMDTPGPFETVSQEAYFNVTLPDPSWDQAKTNEFMAAFNYPTINSTAIHETYPGHYVQFLWMHQVNDRVRKLFGANSNAEGWAHYCEQMMLDEGFGKDSGERELKLLRLGQLTDALLRNARFIVGIKLHTGEMTFNQAVDFFVKEGYQSRVTAMTETKRGTQDPTYLYYTLGKLEILKLRKDVEAKEGAAFDLQKFHDDFMRQGFPPIKIVRKAMLHDDSPVL